MLKGVGLYYGEADISTIDSPYRNGGVREIVNTSPQILHSAIGYGKAEERGGGAYIYGASANPWFFDTLFTHNHVDTSNSVAPYREGGGGAMVYDTSATFDHCLFSGNYSDYYGGGVQVTGAGSGTS